MAYASQYELMEAMLLRQTLPSEGRFPGIKPERSSREAQASSKEEQAKRVRKAFEYEMAKYRKFDRYFPMFGWNMSTGEPWLAFRMPLCDMYPQNIRYFEDYSFGGLFKIWHLTTPNYQLVWPEFKDGNTHKRTSEWTELERLRGFLREWARSDPIENIDDAYEQWAKFPKEHQEQILLPAGFPSLRPEQRTARASTSSSGVIRFGGLNFYNHSQYYVPQSRGRSPMATTPGSSYVRGGSMDPGSGRQKDSTTSRGPKASIPTGPSNPYNSRQAFGHTRIKRESVSSTDLGNVRSEARQYKSSNERTSPSTDIHPTALAHRPRIPKRERDSGDHDQDENFSKRHRGENDHGLD